MRSGAGNGRLRVDSASTIAADRAVSAAEAQRLWSKSSVAMEWSCSVSSDVCALTVILQFREAERFICQVPLKYQVRMPLK